MEKIDEPAQDWMTALDAAQFTARLFGGLTRAQHALAIGLREGLLSAAAEETAICEGEDAEYEQEKCTDECLLGIPNEVWTRSAYFESDRLRWDWEFGDFEIENLDEDCSYLFQGVHFLVSEIEALDPHLALFEELKGDEDRDTRLKSAMSGRRGRTTSHKKWNALIREILNLERQNRLTTTDFLRPKDLRDEIQGELDDDELFDDRHIDPVINYIYNELLVDNV